jgi:hypothetical protein
MSRHIQNPDYRADVGEGDQANPNIVEPVPKRNNLPNEYVIEGQNNSFIVLGIDRLGSPLDPKNNIATSTPRSGMIDLVAGMSSTDPSRVVNEDEQTDVLDGDPPEEILTNPDPFNDAARVYISQRCNVDTQFGLAEGQYGIAGNGSAVVNKADHVRIIGRKTIKLCTGGEPTTSMCKRDDSGKHIVEDNKQVFGIDLIAGNDDAEENLQPLVKGNDLIKYLNEAADDVDRLQGLLQTFMGLQAQFNFVVSQHFHLSPFFGIPTAPCIPLMKENTTFAQKMVNLTRSTIGAKYNINTKKLSYLNPCGNSYILSRYNNTN